MTWWGVYLLVWLTAAATGVVLTWCARSLGRRLAFIDKPYRETHKRHTRAVPSLGGIAMFIAWLLTVFGGYVGGPFFARLLSPRVATYLLTRSDALPRLAVITAGALALVLLGMLDDWRPMHAGWKLTGQVIVAGLTALAGFRITLFIANPWMTWCITVVWIVFVINAINFFDNMDALAAGSTAIAALFFCLTAVLREQYFVAVLAASACGASGGFLVFNWPPASIFMGDAGSHFLGYILAVIGAMTTFYTPLDTPTPAPLLIPLLVLALPVFDLFAVVVIRYRQSRPLHVGDLSHISHRFVRMGLSRARAVMVIHLLSFSIGAGALALLWLPPAGALIVLFQAAAMLAVVSILHASELSTANIGEPGDPAGSATKEH
ncbi:MAG: undecaprenyl/decaprenyl-phosphate alpha-N-acetylglucosaminyl 1-phosphate transferase [Candidatus Pacebacteria bacterium]|nr:undecaprenyl/decaprenyl-phosphate alpha-N-acetylglucosaminyl 1-phosphate transferase [Candidatus Paceibacterota bacterium]